MPTAVPDSEKVAYRVNDFCKAHGVGRTTTYKLIAEGKIKAVKIGGRTLIIKASADALLLARPLERWPSKERRRRSPLRAVTGPSDVLPTTTQTPE